MQIANDPKQECLDIDPSSGRLFLVNDRMDLWKVYAFYCELLLLMFVVFLLWIILHNESENNILFWKITSP